MCYECYECVTPELCDGGGGLALAELRRSILKAYVDAGSNAFSSRQAFSLVPFEGKQHLTNS